MSHTRAKANKYNFAVAFFVALGSFTYGFNSSIIGAVIGQPSFYAYFEFDAETDYGSSILGASNGVYAGAGCIGCWTLFWLLDTLGRKRAIQLIATICIVSAAIQAGSVHIAMFLVGRALNGLGVGFINCAIPTYISEISPPGQRGRIVGSHGLLICTAYGVAGFCGFGTYYEDNPQIQWRLLVALQIVAPLLLLLGSAWIPESPRWLINKGRDEQGLAVLEKLHAHPDDPQNVGAREEFIQIQRQLALERNNPAPSFFWLIFGRKYRKRMFIGWYVQAMAQSTGVLVIANYMVLILNNLGVTGSIPLLLLAVYNSYAACLNFVNALILDRIGRIRTLTIALSGCVVTLIIFTALNAQYVGTDNKAGQACAVLFMFLFVTFYGFGIDVTSYVYCTEIFPTQIRAKGAGWSVSGLFLMTTIYTTAAGPAFQDIGWRFYLVFIIVTACMLPYAVIKFPETKGLSLEEIGALFNDEVILDYSHLSGQEKQALDDQVAASTDLAHFDVEKSAATERKETVDED